MPNRKKLTADQRKEISEMYDEGRGTGSRSKGKYKTGLFTLRQIAEKFNVSQSCVYYVATGQR